MGIFNWNEERHKRRFEERGETPEPEPTAPRLDVPDTERTRWEYGEYFGDTLTYLKVCRIPNVTPNMSGETVIPPGTHVEGDTIVSVDGYRWLRLTKPHDYFGKYLVVEAWDSNPTYIKIEHGLSIPQALYRIKKDDPPRMLTPDWDKNFPSMIWAAPAVHPMYISKNPAHSTKRTRLSPWETYLRTLNDTKNKWGYYTRDNSGLFNRTSWDKQETLVMGNNLVVVDQIESLRENQMMAKLRTLFIEDPEPNADLLNYQTCPWLIHRFTVITRKGYVVDPNPGAIYYPVVVNRDGEGWIELDKLEKFPSLPMTVIVEDASGLNVREKPNISSNKITALAKGESLEITDYRPVGSEVWARCDQGWVALYHPGTLSKYLTSWKMETEPPPP